LKVVRDSGCMRDLRWAVQHNHTPARVVARCVALGFEVVAYRDRIWTCTAPERDQLVVVHTGRVQLRIDPLRPLADRRPAAQALARRVFEGEDGL